MNPSDVIVGLDIGTTLIKVIVSQVDGKQFNVIATGSAPSQGIYQGVVGDITATAKAIKAAVDEAASKANISIDQAVVGVPANQLSIVNVDGLVSIANQNKRITYDDVANVIHQSLENNIPTDREVIELVPDEFIVDGFDGITDPSDMIGVRLEMRGMAYLGPAKLLDNLKMAVEKAGLRVSEFVLTPLAMGKTILDDGEQDFGSVLIDLAGGQSTAAIIHDHKLKFTFVDPEGGDNVTKDISTVLGVSYQDAESIKRDHGYALPELAPEGENFAVKVVGDSEIQTVSEAYLAEIINARLEQIYERLGERLSMVGAMELPGGFIITGGNSALPGSLELAQEMLGSNARLAVPNQIGVRHPGFTRAFAFTLYQAQQSELQRVVKGVIMNALVSGNAHVAHSAQADEAANQDDMVWSADDDEFIEDQPKQGFFHRMGQKLSGLFTDKDD
ncbi:cell division protein FtsA [Lactobacillaceae bacterium L1_55_11]|nr:cell division protein FtsA [Lactobacillaceae bacterium L1_55_11]